MKISEVTFTVNRNGCLKIPAPLLKEMGIVPGDHVRVAYLTGDGMHNTFKEFLITSEGIQGHSEEQRIAIPNELLHQANIPEDANIQVVCLDGVLVIAHEPELNQTELADVLESLWTANDIISRLPHKPEAAWKELKDDIPMQKQRCHEFAAEKGWEIVKEFSEKGVSGFKVSAKDRDAIQEIQKDAAQDKFDILLVFMFDRLGRKEDETPFVVEWFVRNGVEVWSTVEGQQRFDNHVDKLMNYLRYWQASGESLKTSIRTKTRLGQIVQEGRFRGGCAPYGYQLVKNGRIGKKNRELYDIEINPIEAEAVRAIFDISDRYGYGGRRISTELKAKGIINIRTGEPFHYSSIQNILRNIMYQGILRSGETKSEIFPELQIISPEQFARVEHGREQRSSAYEEKCAAAWGMEPSYAGGEESSVNHPPRTVPRRNIGRTLLSGNVYCGHCGGRIFATTARKSHHPTSKETVERIPIYKCYNRTQHKAVCNGPSTYRAAKVDQIVESILMGIFERAKKINEKEFVEQQVQCTAVQYQQALKQARTDYTKYAKEISKWEGLMLDSIEGNCVFTPEQIKNRMDSVQQSMDILTEEIEKLQLKATEAKETAEEIMEQHQRLVSWADMFATASPEEKKMVASYVMRAVTLTRDYGIQIEFNISEAQYLGGMDMG